MLTNEERIVAMHARAAELNRQNRMRRTRIVQSVSTAASLAAVILLAIFMPQTEAFKVAVSGNTSENMQGSLFSGGGEMGYVVIAVIAFLLGVTVTVFSFRFKKYQESKDDSEFAGKR